MAAKTSAPTDNNARVSGSNASEHCDTVPKLLLRNAQQMGSRPAMREKDLGIWQTWNWAQVKDQIEVFSLGLQALGLGKGDCIAIVGDNRPRLYWTFCAAQALGAVPVPVYQDSVAEEMAYVLDHAEVKFAVAENQEQVDKLLSIADKVPSLRKIVYDDDRGLKKYDPANLHSFIAVQELGREAVKDNRAQQDDWLRGIASGRGDDIAVILYTSGTTGKPKGVVLSQENIVKSAINGNEFDGFTADDTMLAYLPMAWVGDHVFSYGQSYAGGMCVACPESVATIDDDRREIAPSYFFAPPRVFETMLTAIMVRMEDASAIKRTMFHYFLGVAKRGGEKILDGKAVGIKDRALYAIGDFLVYGPLRNRMGFTKLRVAYTAGEAIGPELFSFFRSLGINLKQLYGSTEASVYITMQPNGEVYPDTVGKPGPEVEIKIKEDGEVLFRSPGVFREYFKNADATQEAKDTDGWMHTGDAGFMDHNGHLRIIDRAKDVGRMSDGTMFAPKYLENRLKFYPEIKEAFTLGDGREYTTAFINIDLTSVGNWAERHNVNYASYQELAAHSDVYEMIENRIDQLNRALAEEEQTAKTQIRRFLILHKELDADDGELTRTQKVRRPFINERYAQLIDALYGGASHCQINTQVTFEDGRKGIIEGDVRIVDMPVHGPGSVQAEAAE